MQKKRRIWKQLWSFFSLRHVFNNGDYKDINGKG